MRYLQRLLARGILYSLLPRSRTTRIFVLVVAFIVATVYYSLPASAVGFYTPECTPAQSEKYQNPWIYNLKNRPEYTEQSSIIAVDSSTVDVILSVPLDPQAEGYHPPIWSLNNDVISLANQPNTAHGRALYKYTIDTDGELFLYTFTGTGTGILTSGSQDRGCIAFTENIQYSMNDGFSTSDINYSGWVSQNHRLYGPEDDQYTNTVDPYQYELPPLPSPPGGATIEEIRDLAIMFFGFAIAFSVSMTIIEQFTFKAPGWRHD